MWRRFEKNGIFFRLLVVVVVATLITAPYRIGQYSRSLFWTPAVGLQGGNLTIAAQDL